MKISLRVVWVVPALVLALCAFTGCSKPKQNALTGTTPSGGGIASKLTGGVDLKALAEKRKSLTSYTMTMDTDEGKPLSHTVKMENGKPVKIKMDMGDGTLMIMDIAAKVTYMYNPNTNTAMKMPQNDKPEQSAESGAPGMPKMPTAEEMETKMKKFGTETVDGVECWVIGMSGPNGVEMKSWIDKEWGLPRQEKIGDELIKFSFSEINSVPDSAFDLPAGAKIQDMGEMMKGGKMPGMPGG